MPYTNAIAEAKFRELIRARRNGGLIILSVEEMQMSEIAEHRGGLFAPIWESSYRELTNFQRLTVLPPVPFEQWH